nr:hypothetical protein [Mucilaginibacter humi]
MTKVLDSYFCCSKFTQLTFTHPRLLAGDLVKTKYKSCFPCGSVMAVVSCTVLSLPLPLMLKVLITVPVDESMCTSILAEFPG